MAPVTQIGTGSVGVAALAAQEDDVPLAVNMAALADNIQLHVNRSGVTLAAVELFFGYMLPMPAPQIIRIGAGVMTRSASRLAGGGPDWCVAGIAAGKIPVAVSLAAGGGAAIP